MYCFYDMFSPAYFFVFILLHQMSSHNTGAYLNVHEDFHCVIVLITAVIFDFNVAEWLMRISCTMNGMLVSV